MGRPPQRLCPCPRIGKDGQMAGRFPQKIGDEFNQIFPTAAHDLLQSQQRLRPACPFDALPALMATFHCRVDVSVRKSFHDLFAFFRFRRPMQHS